MTTLGCVAPPALNLVEWLLYAAALDIVHRRPVYDPGVSVATYTAACCVTDRLELRYDHRPVR